MSATAPDGEALEPVPPKESRLVLDQLDHEIIRHLQADGRKPYREIARATSVSEGTIRWRVRRLIEAQALRIVAIADPFQLGYQVLGFVLIAVQPGTNNAVIGALVGFPEVTYVSACTGRFDVYAQVVCRDHDHLYELLSERIPAIDGVVRTETFTELKMFKVSYYYPAIGRAPSVD